MFAILAAAEDAELERGVRRCVDEAADLVGGATLLLCTDKLAASGDAQGLTDAALTAWGDGSLVIVRASGAPVPLGFRDVPVIEWAPGGEAAFVATLRALMQREGVRAQPAAAAAASHAARHRWLLVPAATLAVAVVGLGVFLANEIQRPSSYTAATSATTEPAPYVMSVTAQRLPRDAGFKAAPASPNDGQSKSPGDAQVDGKAFADDIAAQLKASGVMAILGGKSTGSVSDIFGHAPEDALSGFDALASMTHETRMALVHSARVTAGTSPEGERKQRLIVLSANIAHQDARIAQLDAEIGKRGGPVYGPLKAWADKRSGRNVKLGPLKALIDERDSLVEDADGLARLLQDELGAMTSAPAQLGSSNGIAYDKHVVVVDQAGGRGSTAGEQRSMAQALAGLPAPSDRRSDDALKPNAASVTVPAAPTPPAPGWAAASSNPWFWIVAAAVISLAAVGGIVRFVYLRRKRGPVVAAATVPAAAAAATPDVALFASYAHADSQRVDAIVDAIERSGVHVWVDRKRLPGGVRWPGEIVKAIRESRALVVFCSTAAFSSDDVFREVHLAARFRKGLIPIALDGAQAPDAFLFYLAPQNFVPADDTRQLTRAIGTVLSNA